MFPATTDRFAEPVEGDSADAALVRPLMAGTRLERAPLRQVSDCCRLSPDALCHRIANRQPAALYVAGGGGQSVDCCRYI